MNDPTTIRFAFPVHNGRLSAHFGHPEYFALVTVDAASKSVVKEEKLVPPPHAPGILPAWLGEQRADVIVVSGIGPRAVALLEQAGMEVVTGVDPLPVEQILELWRGGRLEAGANLCDHELGAGDHECRH